MDEFAKAINAASNISAHEGSEFKVINHHSEYLKGSLYVVGFTGKDGEQKTNYVYIEGTDIHVCKNPALLNEFGARKSKKFGIPDTIEALGDIAGIIGLLITGTIIWMLIQNPEANIPQVLSASLTTILGYYFGSKTSR